MSGDKSGSFKRNIILTAICVVLAGVLIGFLVWDFQLSAQETGRLKEMLNEQRTDTEETESEETEPETEETEPEIIEEEDTAVHAEGISCWGDEFFRGEEAEQYSYRVTLQALLEENGYDLQVTGKTLAGASTLSVMKMAGVAQSELDAYIASHREAANGAELPITETGIRDLTDEQTARTEIDDIPVIFMGYYGGWNHDVQELIEQEQKVLNTFGENKENYIIIGLRPMDGSVDRVTYDEAMTEAWGEHYISAAEVTTQNATTRTGQSQIGQAIYDKLIELEYIAVEQE